MGDDNNDDEFGENEGECIENYNEDVDYDAQDVQNKLDEIKEDQEKRSSRDQVNVVGEVFTTKNKAQRLKDYRTIHGLTYTKDIGWEANVQYLSPPIESGLLFDFMIKSHN
ncbi:hypothetical protein JTB14_030691 [Gonioctena quinquepunctata]|nr:hypothetical protein JTB14_030691 [Gonioctena quinquepunctata]